MTGPVRRLLAAATCAALLGPVGLAGAGAAEQESACPPDRVGSGRFRDVPAGGPHSAAIECVAWWGVAQGRADGSFGPSSLVTRGQLTSFLYRVAEMAHEWPQEPPPDAFGDDDGTTHEHAINEMARARIIRGMPDGTSGHDLPVTRAQAATFVARTIEYVTLERLPSGPRAFDDTRGSVHEPNIDNLAAAGIVAGVGPRTFAPDLPLRRDQMASILARSLAYLVEGDWLELPQDGAGG